jgi:hypothetical protein
MTVLTVTDAVLYHYSKFHPTLQASQLAAALLVVLLGSMPPALTTPAFFMCRLQQACLTVPAVGAVYLAAVFSTL